MEPENQEQEIEMNQEPLIINTQGGAVNSVNGQTGDVVLTTSDLENDSDYQTGSEVESSISDAIGQINIPTKTSDLENDGEDGESVYIEADELDAVATSGDYNDLKNKPTIPTVNDATLTITQNGTSKGTFTANDSDDTTIEVSDTTYSNFTGTDGVSAGTSGLVPAPATTDTDKFLKSDGTWATAGGGGGGDTVYSDKSTSNSSTGGAVYIGNLDSTQAEQPDPTTTDNHYRYFWALPQSNGAIPTEGSVNMLGDKASQYGITLGLSASGAANTYYSITIGTGANANNSYANSAIAIGLNSTVYTENSIGIGRQTDIEGTANKNSIALGSFAKVTRKGELNIGTGGNNVGYSNTDYRVIGGVYDGQNAHDAVTVGQLNATIDAINTALSTNIPHVGA